jgi:electron transport complex protein RnfE
MATGKDTSQLYEEFVKGIWKENPVFVIVLGMCPTLAVTNSAINGVAMAAATMFVLVGSSLLISLLRNWIPNQVRISAYIVVIATFVTVVDFSLEAIAPKVHRELGAFIALIVVNCIIMGRAEAFAAKNTPMRSLLDALGMGLGFTLALLLMGSVREILGNGSLFGINLLGPHFEPWVIMILPPGGFIMLGVWLLVFAAFKERKQKKRLEAERRAA